MIRHLSAHTRGIRRVLFTSLLVIGVLMAYALRQTPVAHADFQTCNPTANCTDMPDTGTTDRVIWCNTWFTQTTQNGYFQRCLHSKQLVLSAKSRKYTIFDMYTTTSPDINNGVYVDWWGSRDSSVDGSATTVHTRLWSTNRTSGCTFNSCDQENYTPLEPGPQCSPTGGSSTVGVSATVEGVGVNISESDPLFYGCLDVPGSDVYSQYYNYTLLDSSVNGNKITQDFTFSQWAPYGYAGKTIKIGLFAKGLFWVHSSCTFGCDFSVDSSNWFDNYVYNS